MRAHEAPETFGRRERRVGERFLRAREAEPQPFFHHRHQQLVFVREVVVRAAGSHADGVGDVAHRGAVEALLTEQPRRDADQLGAAVCRLGGLGLGLFGLCLHGLTSTSN